MEILPTGTAADIPVPLAENIPIRRALGLRVAGRTAGTWVAHPVLHIEPEGDSLRRHLT